MHAKTRAGPSGGGGGNNGRAPREKSTMEILRKHHVISIKIDRN